MRNHVEEEVTLTRYLVLFSVFNGDPSEWLWYLRQRGSPSQKKDDLPFVEWLLDRQQDDTGFLEDLHLMLMPSHGEH